MNVLFMYGICSVSVFLHVLVCFKYLAVWSVHYAAVVRELLTALQILVPKAASVSLPPYNLL